LINRSLVIGASGQVGNQIALTLGDAAVRAARIPPTPDWVEADLESVASCPSKAADLIAHGSYEAIYCVGGATDVERCETDRDWAMNTNYRGPVALARAAIEIPFIYFSTEYVFDGIDGPYTEESKPSPVSVYGLSKSLAEQEILGLHSQALVIRTTVVYGNDSRRKNFLYSLHRSLRSGQKIRVPADQISTPTYNRDLASATLHLARTGSAGIFHICGPDLLSRYEIALKASKVMGLDASLITGVPTAELNQKAPRPLRAGLRIDKLKRCHPSISLRCVEDGIAAWNDTLKGEHQ
jgi:dTDP-4-dehydrorhamnose reductase